MSDPVLALAANSTPYVVAGKIEHRSHVLAGLWSAIDGLNLFSPAAMKAAY